MFQFDGEFMVVQDVVETVWSVCRCCSCVMVQQTVPQTPQMRRGVVSGVPGAPGAPAAEAVDQEPWADRDAAAARIQTNTAGERKHSDSSATPPPAPVKYITPGTYIPDEWTPWCQVLSSWFCPTVDGYWLPWVTWSNCSEGCGGVEVRQRECFPPQNGGRTCAELPGETHLTTDISKNQNKQPRADKPLATGLNLRWLPV